MGFAPYGHSDRPTLREANGRMLYLANNMQKADAGNWQYGGAPLPRHTRLRPRGAGADRLHTLTRRATRPQT